MTICVARTNSKWMSGFVSTEFDRLENVHHSGTCTKMVIIGATVMEMSVARSIELLEKEPNAEDMNLLRLARAFLEFQKELEIVMPSLRRIKVISG